MTAQTRCTEIRVQRIDHPRGDGLGRALVLDCHGGALTLLFDDPGELWILIEQLSDGLDWVTERSRDAAGRPAAIREPGALGRGQADGAGEEHISRG